MRITVEESSFWAPFFLEGVRMESIQRKIQSFLERPSASTLEIRSPGGHHRLVATGLKNIEIYNLASKEAARDLKGLLENRWRDLHPGDDNQC